LPQSAEDTTDKQLKQSATALSFIVDRDSLVQNDIRNSSVD